MQWNFANLSQRVLTPTTVFSFYYLLGALPGHTALYGPEFQIYPPALAIQRANFIYGILNGQYGRRFPIDRDAALRRWPPTPPRSSSR